MKLLVESLNAEFLTEESNGKKYHFLEGIFMQSEIKNKNGRLYPRGIMESGVNRYLTEKVSNRTAYGELGHPEGPKINEDRISHLIEKLEFKGNDVIGRAKILDTTQGTIAQKILEGGGRLGVSSRALGSLREANGVKVVQSDFNIRTAADIVTDPSAPGAFPDALYEDAEWIYEAGQWVPRFADDAKKEIRGASKSQFEEIKLKHFQLFLENIKKYK